MSIFKSQAVILKINKIEGNSYLYDLFSKDYGMIQCNISRGKKEKNLDVGYLIDSEISVKNGRDIHSIYNIKILGELSSDTLGFNVLYAFLELLNIIKKALPKGVPQEDMFYCLHEVILFEKHYKKSLTLEKIIYMKIKILQLTGELGYDHDHSTIQKILQFIYKNKPRDIIKLQGLEGKVIREFEAILLLN